MTSQRERELLQMIRERDEKIAAQQSRIDSMEKENALLKQKVDLLVRRIFGASSEKLDAAQLELLFNGEGEAGKGCASSEKEGAAITPIAQFPIARPNPGRPRRERAQRLPENLPVVEKIIEPEAVKANPEVWRCIGSEVSEQLDYHPAQFVRLLFIRPKYVRRNELDAVPVIAPLHPVLQERGIAAPGLLAQIVVSKYCDHLPLYRQEQIYWSRHGVWLPRQTQARWMGLAADWLFPIYETIRAGVFSGPCVQVDETPIEYLVPGNGETRKGYLWVCNQPEGGVVFHWETSRAASCLENIIPKDFRGVLQCDAYSAYGAFASERGEAINLAGCYAHVRRKFYEAKEQAPQISGWLLRQIGHLYNVEQKLRLGRAGPRLREAIRAAQSRMVHHRIHRLLIRLKTSKRYLPQSLMGKAIDYALNQWSTLGVYLGNGRVEIDNNLVENAIRPTAIGKKNWLFMGDADAGQRGAVLYTIVENCRRQGVDPYAYLRDVLAKLPTMTNWQTKDATPEAYAKAQSQPVRRAAA